MDALLIGTFSMSAITFCGTIYFNRKNLITTKYIDTITAHRIKRTDAIRDEVADITRHIDLSLNTMSKEIDDKTSEQRDLSNDPEYQSKLNWNLCAVYASIAFKPESTNLSISDLVYKFNHLKLRLNPNEDNEIIGVINYFMLLYTDGELKFDKDIKDAKKNVNLLNVQFQKLFKNEWEKIENETYGKIRKWRFKNWFNKLLRR